MSKIVIPGQIIEILRERSEICVLGHVEPDGDCLGSQLALGSFLRRMGKSVTLHSPGPFDRSEIRVWESQFETSVSEERLRVSPLVVVLDCSTLDRIGDLAEAVEGLELMVIDHHSSGESFGDYRCIYPEAPSVTYLIQLLIEQWGQAPTTQEADYLMFGFCTDTGFFRHLTESATEPLAAVSRLTRWGASPNRTYHQIHGHKTFASCTHLGVCLSRAEAFFDKRVFVSWESFEERQQLGPGNGASTTLYSLLQEVDRCEGVVFLRGEGPGEFSVGLRSNNDLDMGKLARHFGGGGHAKAAGFSYQGTLPELKEAILSHLETLIQSPR